MRLTKTQTGVPTRARDIDDVVGRFFNAPTAFPIFNCEPIQQALETSWMPALDFAETEKEFVIRAEVPGVPRENLDAHLEGDILTLTGHRERNVHEANENILWEESETGKIIRSIRLPKAVEARKVEAEARPSPLAVPARLGRGGICLPARALTPGPLRLRPSPQWHGSGR